MATITVGPGKQFATIDAGVKAAAAGDTVAVSGGPAITYTNDFIYINKPLTLTAVGGMVRMQATSQPPSGKGMIIAGVSNTAMAITIQGFEVWGVKVPDQNGAAVRYEGGNLTLKDVYFHDNQEGLLANPQAAGTIVIDHSEFDHNGFASGFSHNIYVNKLASLTVKNSYIHDAIIGHEIKSRADTTVITNNRIQDNLGTASYSIDLPNAGNATITGNTIQQGLNSDNVFVVAYGEEGASNAGRSVLISGNTFVNDMIGTPSSPPRGINNKSTTALPYTNNTEFKMGSDAGPIAESGTVQLATRPPVDTAHLTFIISGVPTTPPPPVPPTTPPPPPPPAPMTLAEYHAEILADFSVWSKTATSVQITTAMPIFAKEFTSTTVLGILPGDVWTHF